MSPGSSIFIYSVQTVAKAVIKKSLAYLGHLHQKLEFGAEHSCAVSRPQKRAGTHRGCEPGEPALPQLLCMKVSENGTITKTAQTNTQDSGALATLLGRCVINPPHTNLNTTGHQGKQRNFCNDPTLPAATTWVPCLCFSWGTGNFCCRPLYSPAHFFQKVIHASNWFPWP